MRRLERASCGPSVDGVISVLSDAINSPHSSIILVLENASVPVIWRIIGDWLSGATTADLNENPSKTRVRSTNRVDDLRIILSRYLGYVLLSKESLGKEIGLCIRLDSA